MKVADLIRARAARAGFDLGHVPDDELGARLVAMPLDVSDDPEQAGTWLVYGTRDGPRDGVGQGRDSRRR